MEDKDKLIASLQAELEAVRKELQEARAETALLKSGNPEGGAFATFTINEKAKELAAYNGYYAILRKQVRYKEKILTAQQIAADKAICLELLAKQVSWIVTTNDKED